MISKQPAWLTGLQFDHAVSHTGKKGEELLHEVAARYVEGMKDMDGRAPGPSSILGENIFESHITINYGNVSEKGFFLCF